MVDDEKVPGEQGRRREAEGVEEYSRHYGPVRVRKMEEAGFFQNNIKNRGNSE